jgi:two-component system sensor histidine kinase/response regulator
MQMVIGRRVAPVERSPVVTRHSIRESRRRLRVLLAEDNVVNQKLTVQLLQKQEHTVVAVSNGQEALAALAQQPFDLILMDVQMPIMDGLEATAAIRERERPSGLHVPIIAMTAHAMQGDRERCLAIGMDGYVTKPMKAADLYAAIAPLLHEASAPAQPAVEPPIDLSAALSTVDGDKVLLMDIIGVFLQDYPTCLQELRDAINAGDELRIERTAHSLRGAVSNFVAQTAYALAYELEIMGRRAELDRAPMVLQQLERELERIARFVSKANCQGG